MIIVVVTFTVAKKKVATYLFYLMDSNITISANAEFLFEPNTFVGFADYASIMYNNTVLLEKQRKYNNITYNCVFRADTKMNFHE